MFKAKPRRVPRKIATEDDDDQSRSSNTAEPSTVVRRPNTKSKKTSLRTSIALDDDDALELSDSPIAALKASKPPLARVALERSAGSSSPASNQLPYRANEDRPSYSADYLAELKSSTPVRPKVSQTPASVPDDTDDDDDPPPTLDIDIASKYGSSTIKDLAAASATSIIPTEAEIREKKERRQRLKHDQDFISLDDGGAAELESGSDAEDHDPRSRSLIIPADEIDIKSKYGESRLVHEDEDIAEGFDDFVEDPGRVTLNRRAARDQEAQRKKDIAAQIKGAQLGDGFKGSGDEDNDSIDEEEAERIAAYEASQTRAGTSGSKSSRQREKEREESLRKRLERPPKLTPIPDLSAVKAMFQQRADAKSEELRKQRGMLEQLRRDFVGLEEEESRLQDLLKEAGDRFERLNAELHPSEVESSDQLQTQIQPQAAALAMQQQGRGLESLGGMSAAPKDEWNDA